MTIRMSVSINIKPHKSGNINVVLTLKTSELLGTFIKDLLPKRGRVQAVMFNDFQQNYSYILLVGFIGDGNRSTRGKSLTNIKREGEVKKVVLTLETRKLY